MPLQRATAQPSPRGLRNAPIFSAPRPADPTSRSALTISSALNCQISQPCHLISTKLYFKISPPIATTCLQVNGVKILETLPCTFDNLKGLKLFMHFCELPQILLVFCFLKSMPNLEKLKIRIYDGEVQKIELNAEFLNAQWADGMCANLEILEMTGISWLPNEMSFMKLILSKARRLHMLCISHHDDCSVSHVDPLHELVTYGKASAQAQVLFKGAAGNY